MRVTSNPVSERSVTLDATLDELIELYDATRKGRRTRGQEKALLEFGDALRAADSDVDAAISAAEEESEGASTE